VGIVLGYSAEGYPCGETHPRAKLADAVVWEIRDRYENRKEGIRAIARSVGVEPSTVSRIVRYQRRVATPAEYREVND